MQKTKLEHMTKARNVKRDRIWKRKSESSSPSLLHLHLNFVFNISYFSLFSLSTFFVLPKLRIPNIEQSQIWFVEQARFKEKRSSCVRTNYTFSRFPDDCSFRILKLPPIILFQRRKSHRFLTSSEIRPRMYVVDG